MLELLVEEPVSSSDQFAYVEALHKISGQQGPFVLLVDIRHQLDLQQESRKAQNLWFKASRETMELNCYAAAIVRLNPSPEQQRTFAGLWRFPVLVTGARDDAHAFLADILSKAPFRHEPLTEGHTR